MHEQQFLSSVEGKTIATIKREHGGGLVFYNAGGDILFTLRSDRDIYDAYGDHFVSDVEFER